MLRLKLNRVYVEASITAKPLFAKLGFLTICENTAQLGDIQLLNYKMERLNDQVDCQKMVGQVSPVPQVAQQVSRAGGGGAEWHSTNDSSAAGP